MNIQYISISYCHDNVCTCVVIIHTISDGLRLLHTFALSLVIYKFGRTLSFIIGQTWLHSVLTLCRFLVPRRTMSMYDFFLPTLSSFVFMFDLINYVMDLTSYIFPTRSLVEGGPICIISMCFHPMINS